MKHFSLIRRTGFKCECGQKSTRHGFHSDCRIERGNSKFRVFKTYDYIHRHCSLAQKEGRDSAVYNTLSSGITKQLALQIVPHMSMMDIFSQLQSSMTLLPGYIWVVGALIQRLRLRKKLLPIKLAKMEELDYFM